MGERPASQHSQPGPARTRRKRRLRGAGNELSGPANQKPRLRSRPPTRFPNRQPSPPPAARGTGYLKARRLHAVAVRGPGLSVQRSSMATHIVLSNGAKMPFVGLGTWKVGAEGARPSALVGLFWGVPRSLGERGREGHSAAPQWTPGLPVAPRWAGRWLLGRAGGSREAASVPTGWVWPSVRAGSPIPAGKVPKKDGGKRGASRSPLRPVAGMDRGRRIRRRWGVPLGRAPVAPPPCLSYK